MENKTMGTRMDFLRRSWKWIIVFLSFICIALFIAALFLRHDILKQYREKEGINNMEALERIEKHAYLFSTNWLIHEFQHTIGTFSSNTIFRVLMKRLNVDLDHIELSGSELRKLIKNRYWQIRSLAVHGILLYLEKEKNFFEKKKTIASLIEIMADPKWQVQKSIRFIWSSGISEFDPTLFSAFKEAFKNTSNIDIKRNISYFYSSYPSHTQDVLLQLLQNTDKEIQINAMIGIDLETYPEAFIFFVKAAQDENDTFSLQAFSALSKLEPLPLELFTQFSRHANPIFRRRFAWMLGLKQNNRLERKSKNKDTRSIDVLITFLKDKEFEVRRQASQSLMLFKEPEIVQPLIEALHDSDPQVRANAALGLAGTMDKRALQPLLKLSIDPDWQVREKVAFGLGKLGDTIALHILDNLMKDDDWHVRAFAVQAIGKIKKQ